MRLVSAKVEKNRLERWALAKLTIWMSWYFSILCQHTKWVRGKVYGQEVHSRQNNWFLFFVIWVLSPLPVLLWQCHLDSFHCSLPSTLFNNFHGCFIPDKTISFLSFELFSQCLYYSDNATKRVFIIVISDYDIIIIFGIQKLVRMFPSHLSRCGEVFDLVL